MTSRPIKNLPASVLQKLLNNAKQTKRPYTEILRYYAMERYLYRLAKSPYADKFILKGALMFTAWRAATSRPTKDIDVLGRMDNDVANLVRIAKEICRQQIEPDGVVFVENSITGNQIIEEAKYAGARIKISGTLGTARLSLQLDVGFGDIVHPAPRTITYPTLIGSPAPQLKGYSKESVIAEKYEIVVSKGRLNSRLKDYYDLWLLTQQFDFKGKVLAEAIHKTFAHRGTSLAAEFDKAFSDDFRVGPMVILERFAEEEGKDAQWKAFLRTNRLEGVPGELKGTVKVITAFLKPVTTAIVIKKPFDKKWKAPGPWKRS